MSLKLNKSSTCYTAVKTGHLSLIMTLS